jgi:DNA modification methylase
MNADPITCNGEAGRLCVQRMVGRHSTATLILGDSETMELPKADAVITDPPYGTGEHARLDGEITKTRAEWDVWDAEMLKGIDGRVAMFLPPQRLLEENWKGWRLLAWVSENPMKWKNVAPRFGIQPIIAKGRFPDIASLDWRKHRNNIQTPEHPHQKPLPIMAWLVEMMTLEGETILDPYMGSGSTGVAACRLHRNFVGIERDAAHYKTACDRIAHELDGALL